MAQPPGKHERQRATTANSNRGQRGYTQGQRQFYREPRFPMNIHQQHHPQQTPNWNWNQLDFTADDYRGNQYMPFDQRRPYTAPKQLIVKKSNFDKVVPIDKAPVDMKTETYTIDKNDILMFGGNKHWLSTFYPAEMSIDGHKYPSIEHYYQACKLYMLSGPASAAQIRQIRDAGRVKQAARELLKMSGVSYNEMDMWKMTHGPQILRHALLHKFVQHTELRDKLIATSSALLAHVYEHDKIFAVGMDEAKFEEWTKEHNEQKIEMPADMTIDLIKYYPYIGVGKNLLGIILMRVRRDCAKLKDLLTTATGESLSADDPLMTAAMSALQLTPRTHGTPETKATKAKDTNATEKDDKENSKDDNPAETSASTKASKKK